MLKLSTYHVFKHTIMLLFVKLEANADQPQSDQYKSGLSLKNVSDSILKTVLKLLISKIAASKAKFDFRA